ncbi:DUF3795 domain-containing protein [candidate division WOR-3 bacterium]|nr:DUF3795 domain-containing protein [candidate division WOR-3 bacterium]
MNKKKKELIAYCGLYCGDCFGYKGKIADLARDIRKELRQEKFDIIVKGIPFKAFKNYKECYEVLGALVRLRCKNTCRGGGGNPFCKIRKCCQKKNIDGCWECKEFETCKKLDFLKANHGNAHIKNLRKLTKKSIQDFLKGKKYWYSV